MFDVSRISLVKQDGTRINDIHAHVQPTMIFIDDAALPIEEGDRFLRRLPNGLAERYLVLDRGYWDGPGMRPHYQVKVRKETGISVEVPGLGPKRMARRRGPISPWFPPRYLWAAIEGAAGLNLSAEDARLYPHLAAQCARPPHR